MKYIKTTCCADCPFRIQDPGSSHWSLVCIASGLRAIKDSAIRPDWCPLPITVVKK